MELDIDYIKSKIQDVLIKVHKNPHKHKITTKHDRLTFACPICGDSQKNMHQKRGHLFFNNLYFKCYNEDCRSNFTKLCKSNNIHIDADKRMQLINYIDLNFHKIEKDDYALTKLDKLISFEDFEKWMQNNVLFEDFQRPKFGSSVYIYLKNRGFNDEQITTYFYECNKKIKDYKIPHILFLNQSAGKIIGMQERNLKSGLDRRFKVWTFSELYKTIYEEELDEIEAISYNKLSYLFNIFNVNYEKIITAFEGYIDSLFLPNSIGAVGADTDYSIFTNNEVDIRFFFDNDIKGKKSSLYWLKRGYSVFLWEKLINDLSKLHLDPYQFKQWFNDNIKDINDLVFKLNIHYKELEKYFSSSLFDTIYINIPKQIKPINKHINDINSIITELKIKSNRLI